MKVILACEGPSEVYLLENLINNNVLKINFEIFLDKPIVMRQLKEYKPIIDTLPIDEEILVYRIGDTINDKLCFKGFELRKKFIKEFKICTKPEIEILIIINENWYKKYLKTRTKVCPKEFVKSKISHFNIKDYFDHHDMYRAICEYNRIKKKTKNEYSLYDLINNSIK